MSSNVAGYLQPSSSESLPGGLSLIQFLQTVMVGVSGFDGKLVRPRWQIEPPKDPDVLINWLGFGIVGTTPDTFAYNALNAAGNYDFMRNEVFELAVSVYGPNAYENMRLIQDGFQVTQNLESLQLANMGLVNTTAGIHAPELINERWFDRYDFSIFIRRQIQRVYPVLSFLSASGSITVTKGDEEWITDWEVPEET